ncbi:MAG: hypothetical protein OEZ01_00565 [Candidatus Heimdallarchaeota archaeon]|nr:hypothetical protein [Candidatus Heimdallarchaeota archaeon]MDH5676613.1 hypothetical protein [Myxococcales bacterium]
MALGDNTQHVESLGRSQTSLNVYQTKVTLTTPVLPAGDYLVCVSALYQTDSAETNEIQFRVLEDGATTAYESGVLREANPGNAAGDSQDTFYVSMVRTLGAGSHTFALEYRRTGTVDLVTVEEARIEFFEMDGTYLGSASDAYAFTTSTTYINKVLLNTGAIAAGTYHIGFSVEYACQDPNNTNNMGLRFRERRDPVGVDVITNLLGDDAGLGKELQINNGGYGYLSTDPRQVAAWEQPCRVLTADTYQYELDYRAVGGAFDEVAVALARINLWRMS